MVYGRWQEAEWTYGRYGYVKAPKSVESVKYIDGLLPTRKPRFGGVCFESVQICYLVAIPSPFMRGYYEHWRVGVVRSDYWLC
jgi:hypothetical protein